MKTAALVLGSIAAASAASLDIRGFYSQGTTVGPATCCFPTGQVKVSQPAGTDDTVAASVTLTFPNDAKCKDAFKGKVFTGGSIPDATSKLVTIATGVTFDSTTGATHALDVSGTSSTAGVTCTVPLTKVSTVPTYTYQGIYTPTLVGTAASCCMPAGDVVLTGTTSVNYAWTWANSATDSCAAAKKNVDVTGTATTPDTVVGDIYFTNYPLTTPPSTTTLTPLTIDISSASSAASPDCKITLASKTKATHTYPRIYKVKTEVGSTSNACCYPDDDGVEVTQDGTTVSVSWKFDNTDSCKVAALKGVEISGSGTPNAITGDVSFTDESLGWVLEYPSDADGDWKLNLKSENALCEAVLETKSGYLLGLGSLVAVSLSYIMF